MLLIALSTGMLVYMFLISKLHIMYPLFILMCARFLVISIEFLILQPKLTGYLFKMLKRNSDKFSVGTFMLDDISLIVMGVLCILGSV